MMSWNHRILKLSDDTYTITEAFYNENNEIMGWAEGGVEPMGETINELRKELIRMLACLEKPYIVDTEAGETFYPVEEIEHND
jgi:hypothetical protein